MEIHYVSGDATRPAGDKSVIIVHICNDAGVWGGGFVLALSERWRKPEQVYKMWHALGRECHLGKVQFVEVEDGLIVCNMIAMSADGYSRPPVHYGALEGCLARVRDKAKDTRVTVHMPRIGTGIAGGDWDIIEKIIERELCDKGVNVTVYTLPKV